MRTLQGAHVPIENFFSENKFLYTRYESILVLMQQKVKTVFSIND